MPANPEDLYQGILAIVAAGPAEQAVAQRDSLRALQLLHAAAAAPDTLTDRIAQAAKGDPGLRCALPFEPGIAAGHVAPADGPERPSVLAVDGSQLMTDRHDQVLFAVINVGSVEIVPGSGQTPRVGSRTQLLHGEQLRTVKGGVLSQGDLALKRDAAERNYLLETAGSPGSIALTDGPLELWGPKDASDPRAYDRALKEYLDGLVALNARGVTLAGYVDKPAADLVIRMLELQPSGPADGADLGGSSLLRGASDRRLFADILGPGARSAVFALQSSSRPRYSGDLALHFFYLNVGGASRPAIARVEIPLWVARDPARIEELHRCLLEESRILGARPYPYVLHRAHETARISLDEKELITQRILVKLRAGGLEPEPISNKASVKNVSHREGRRK